MWYSKSKCQRIGVSMKVSHKQLKVILMLEVRNFGLSSVVSKLVEFPLFDDFIPDLAKFQDLNIFSLFHFPNLNNFPNFLACFTLFLLTPNLLILLLPTFGRLKIDFSNCTVVFTIKMSRAAILLKLWMNCQ